jgi:hypothetical protein
MGGPFAAMADEDRLAGLDLEHGDEEYAQIVVHPREIGLVQPASRAAPGRLFQNLDLGLDAAYEKEETFDHARAPGLICWKDGLNPGSTFRDPPSPLNSYYIQPPPTSSAASGHKPPPASSALMIEKCGQ